jgi:hypothetical protein
MNAKRFVLVIGVSLALVSALGAGVLIGSIAHGTAFAQGPTATPPAFGPGWMMGRGPAAGQAYTGTVPFAGQGFGPGMMGAARGYGYDQVMIPSLAKALGLSVDQLNAELKAGKTVQQLAQEKGISTEKLVADVLAAHKEYLQKLVSDGKLTQQQADWMIQRMESIQNHPCLTGDVVPGQGLQGGFGRGRGGMMGGGFGARGFLGVSN